MRAGYKSFSLFHNIVYQTNWNSALNQNVYQQFAWDDEAVLRVKGYRTFITIFRHIPFEEFDE